MKKYYAEQDERWPTMVISKRKTWDGQKEVELSDEDFAAWEGAWRTIARVEDIVCEQLDLD